MAWLVLRAGIGPSFAIGHTAYGATPYCTDQRYELDNDSRHYPCKIKRPSHRDEQGRSCNDGYDLLLFADGNVIASPAYESMTYYDAAGNRTCTGRPHEYAVVEDDDAVVPGAVGDYVRRMFELGVTRKEMERAGYPARELHDFYGEAGTGLQGP